MKFEVVKKKIEKVFLLADGQTDFVSHEGETFAELQKKISKVKQKPFLEFPFLGVLGQRQEVEGVGIFKQLLGEIGLRFRQGVLKIRERLPTAPVSLAFDLVDKDIPAPAVLDGGPRIPQAVLRRFEAVKEGDVVAPTAIVQQLVGQLSHPDRLLRNPACKAGSHEKGL